MRLSTAGAERKLVAGLQQGESEAWSELCRTYGEPLFRYAYHHTGDAAAADDVRQETLLAAVEGMGSYRGEVPLFGWLCGIARHKVADELRRRGREHLPVEAERCAGGPRPDEVLERDETRAAVIEALWSLPADYRLALVARYLEGTGVETVAARLNRSYKAAESLLSRAREALWRRLKEGDQK
jgi:RNA polymerase sigma-70 factor (ECF subfamily)